ncbi:hypothetical protein [Planktosalinus lacus]|nr:hypothetical protein [Planktosalinus lacus]
MIEFLYDMTYEEHLFTLYTAFVSLLVHIVFKFFIKLKLNKILNLILKNLFLSLTIVLVLFVIINYKGEINLIIVSLLAVIIVMLFGLFILKYILKMRKQIHKEQFEILKIALDSDKEILEKLFDKDVGALNMLLDKIKNENKPMNGEKES